MFKLTNEPTFTHTVTALVPIDGGHEEQSFKATFLALDPSETDAFDLSTTKGSTDFLKRVVKKLDEIEGADGKAIPFSDKLLDQVLKLPWARAAISKAYFGALTKAAEGN